MFDVIIAGSGFSGATAARSLAENLGKRVLVLEKRGQIGGNMYDSPDINGVLVQRFGPHIFHTRSRRAFDFLSRFARFIPYEHRVLGKINGRLVPIPFNFTGFDMLFDAELAELIKNRLKTAFPGREKVSVLELLSAPDSRVRQAGEFVYKNVFENYTAKQWGIEPSKVDKSVINRVPVVLGYDDRYFSDEYQYMPEGGFTRLFERMLKHPNITVITGCDALTRLSLDFAAGRILFDGKPFSGPVVFTGPVDELMGFRYGPLPYRSLELVFERVDATYYQPAAVVNYPNEEEYTRITEFKYLYGQRIEGATTILKEYPVPYEPGGIKGNIPYYPIASPENHALYERYRALAESFGNLYLCGRLAEYKYYNMDAAVLSALELAERIAF